MRPGCRPLLCGIFARRGHASHCPCCLAQGLSYTSFSYEWSDLRPARLLATQEIAALYHNNAAIMGQARLPESLYHTVRVANTGSLTADCVVLAFITAVATVTESDAPIKKLFGFERLKAMKPGERRTVTFASGPDVLANADASGRLVLMPGRRGIEVGDIATPAKRDLTLTGPPTVVRQAPGAMHVLKQH